MVASVDEAVVAFHERKPFAPDGESFARDGAPLA